MVDYVLVATGRRSHLDSLNLQQIDSQFGNLKELPIDPQTKQLGNYPIFVVGDAHTSTPFSMKQPMKAEVQCITALIIQN